MKRCPPPSHLAQLTPQAAAPPVTLRMSARVSVPAKRILHPWPLRHPGRVRAKAAQKASTQELEALTSQPRGPKIFVAGGAGGVIARDIIARAHSLGYVLWNPRSRVEKRTKTPDVPKPSSNDSSSIPPEASPAQSTRAAAPHKADSNSDVVSALEPGSAAESTQTQDPDDGDGENTVSAPTLRRAKSAR